jgi:16S rRNA (uracil1498-N3)-methyltransferase
VPRKDIQGDLALVTGDEFRHLFRVLRLRQGDTLEVFDGEGQEYSGILETLEEEKAQIRLGSPRLLAGEAPLQVWLVRGLPKGDKMELIIQKATELGVSGVIPLEMERSIVKLDAKRKLERRERWQKVALEATKQCHRSIVPEIRTPCSVQEFITTLPEDYILLVPWEEGGLPLQEVLSQEKPLEPVYILIGPEGGIEKKEVERIKQQNGRAVTLGNRILRTETAGFVTISLVMYQWGDLGK